MAQAKNVVEPKDAVEKAPAPSARAENAAPAKVVVFWKRMNPFQKIQLKDGSELVFGKQTFATADEKLIQKIKEVAGRYGIFVQKD